MGKTKVCEQCGKEYARKPYESNFTWERRICCSLSCAGQRATVNRHMHDTVVYPPKTCPQCGRQFYKPSDMPPSAWKRRTYCGATCGKKTHATLTNRYVKQYCECGQPTTGIVWILQGDASLHIHPEFVEVCDDCRDMWLADGATLEKPEVDKEGRRQCRESEYGAQAHFHSWNHTKGARPI